MNNTGNYIIETIRKGDFRKKLGRIHKDILIEMLKDINEELKNEEKINISYYDNKKEIMNKIEKGGEIILKRSYLVI